LRTTPTSTRFPYTTLFRSRTVEAIIRGKKRILITMATGTGKTTVAFQICYKLWQSHWNLRNDAIKRPKIPMGLPKLITDLEGNGDRKSTRLNSSHDQISYA